VRDLDQFIDLRVALEQPERADEAEHVDARLRPFAARGVDERRAQQHVAELGRDDDDDAVDGAHGRGQGRQGDGGRTSGREQAGRRERIVGALHNPGARIGYRAVASWLQRRSRVRMAWPAILHSSA
jgi:hypothetical protein